MKAFDPLGALERLSEHQVDFVLIGGLAARLHGSPTVTDDLDICHSTDIANLERLAEALRSMNARLRGAEDATVPLDAALLRSSDNLTFTTDFGSVDCMGSPAGIGGFEELERDAEMIDLDGTAVRVASLEELMTMKRAAGRPQDLIELELLGALRDELEEQG
jgi:hypothetical protein